MRGHTAQRFALMAAGQAWILLGSRKKIEDKKCLKTAQNPHRPRHVLLGAFFLKEPVPKT